MNSDLLITDRTLADVNLNTDKGNYNISDLNRVTQYCTEMAETIASMLLAKPEVLDKEWSIEMYPTEIDIANYLKSVYNVIEGYYKKNIYSLPKDLNNFNYESANIIEQALSDIDKLITNQRDCYLYSGQCFSGEGGLRGGVI